MTRLKKSIALFLLLTFTLSAIFHYLIIARGLILTWFLMWCPGVSALIVNRIYYPKQKNLGLHKLHKKDCFVGVLLPIIYFGLSYAIFWITFGGFMPRANAYFNAPLLLLILIPISVLTVLGEEIGWRGFLVPKLTKLLGFRKAVWLSGLIWAVWHFPIVLSGDYLGDVPMWFLLPVFIIMVLMMGALMAILRVSSGSVWPIVLLHASHNYVAQAILDPSTTGTLAPYLVGEAGVLTAIVIIVCVAILWKRRKHDVQET